VTFEHCLIQVKDALAILCSSIFLSNKLWSEELRFLRWQKERTPSSSVARNALLKQQPKTQVPKSARSFGAPAGGRLQRCLMRDEVHNAGNRYPRIRPTIAGNTW
jgi:hypothetical protein